MAKKQGARTSGGRRGPTDAEAIAENMSLVEAFLKGMSGPAGVTAPPAAATKAEADADAEDAEGAEGAELEPPGLSLRIEGAPRLPQGAAEALLIDAERLLAALQRADQELSLVLCDDAFIRPLNASWRGKDSATDVLSFPQAEGDAAGALALGDLVISVETAAAAAAQLGHSLQEELKVLLVHGVLHLIGHDHEQGGEQAQRMRAEEARLLPLIGGAAGLIARTEGAPTEGD
jgi:probable rRNA maturation factor